MFGARLILGFCRSMLIHQSSRPLSFGLTSQLRKAAVSVPANFAEGFKKLGLADKVRFYNIAQGSLEECRYYLILARDLGYGDSTSLTISLDDVGRMLDGYSRAIRRTY